MGKFETLPRCPTTGKMCHPTRRSALEQLASLEQAGKGDSNTCPFLCRFCNEWHLGHDRKRFNDRGEKSLRNALSSGRMASNAAKKRRTR